MRRGRHAAEDGSFGRSAGMAAGRGTVLLAVAVALGIVLLNAADDPPPSRVSAGQDGTATPPSVARSTTTPTLPPTTAPARLPKDVKVLSVNGTDVKGAARKATDVLKSSGYNVLAPTDAKQKVAVSAVYATAGYERDAQAVAGALGLPASSVQALPTPPPADPRGANVVLVVGPELAQRLTASSTTTAAGGATTTTTAARTTTTRP